MHSLWVIIILLQGETSDCNGKNKKSNKNKERKVCTILMWFDDDDDVDLDTSDDEVRIKEQDLFMHVCLIMFCRKKLQGRKKEGV